jgi:hypothetical protein
MKRIVFVMAVGVAMAMVVAAINPKKSYAGPVIPIGALMVSTSNGLVQEWDTSTTPPTFVALLDTTGTLTFGSVFDVAGNFFVTQFSDEAVAKFDPTGLLIGPFGSGYNMDPESDIVNAASDLFVGQADGTHQMLEFSPAGVLLNTFAPAIEGRGTDWIDLASDQCTMFYTSEGPHIKRFNVCTNTQLPDFNPVPLPGVHGFAQKIRANHEILVADSEEFPPFASEVTRLDASGNQIQHYLASSIEPGNTTPDLFALVLDRDGTSFWVGDSSSDVFKVDIASGAVLTHFNAATDCTGCGASVGVGGLAEKGQIQVSNPPPVCTNASASVPTLFPPNHKFVTENVLGVTDVSGPFTIDITAITSNQPLNGGGSGHTCPDASGVGTDTAMVRSEREGTSKDGRTYHIAFTATDINGNSCTGSVPVCIPHDQGHGGGCTDSGAMFDATHC